MGPAWCSIREPLPFDARVREAILQMFDFEWINHNYFFDLYKRTASDFDGAHGVPANERERELLKPFPDAARADMVPLAHGPCGGAATVLVPCHSLGRAFALLRSCGYDLKGTQLNLTWPTVHVHV